MNRLPFCSLTLLLLAACHSTDRRGVRVNDAQEAQRDVTRVYARPASEVCDAAISAVKKMELRIDDDRHDRLGGTIVARRANGDRLVITVEGIDETSSRVRIQVDPNNGNLATQLHDKISSRLGLSRAKAATFGGNTAKGSYAVTLSRAATTAESTLHRSGFDVTRIDVQQEKAAFDARDCDSVPVRIELDRDGDASVRAVFTVGSASDADWKARARRLKAEFERELNPSPEQ